MRHIIQRVRALRNPIMFIAVLVLGVSIAFAADDGSCWKPRLPVCPDGVSSQNGKRCGLEAVIEVTDEIERTQEAFCDGHSKGCQNADKQCNVKRIKDATWRRVYCVKSGDPDSRTPIGWCLDQEFGNQNTNTDCSGKKCRPNTSKIGPTKGTSPTE